MILLSVLSLFLFVKLGLWQLTRAGEKELMQRQFQQLQLQRAISIGDGIKPRQYQGVKAQGKFLNDKQFLLDNQHVNHQFGYHVLTPLLLGSGDVVIVDRGFLKGNIDRTILPPIEHVKAFLKLRGHSYYPSKKTFHLGPIVDNGNKWPKVVESIDLTLFSQLLHKPVLPFIIRLNDEQKYGFVRKWQIIAMSPTRHRAYAFQWFSFAAIVFILFIVLNVERVSEK
jgi:surfeit locus 1 family protein